MPNEEFKQPHLIKREDLYREVWETPMSKLAEKYGVSGGKGREQRPAFDALHKVVARREFDMVAAALQRDPASQLT